MTHAAKYLAGEWIKHDDASVKSDIARLGVDGAINYQMELIAGCRESGDRRWDEVTEASMRMAIQSFIK